MIEKAFGEARQHKDNKRNAVRQFALDRAMDLLRAAGVVDPAIKDQVVATKPQTMVEESLYFIPEGVGVRWALDIGGMPADQLEAGASVRNVSGGVVDMIHHPKFTTLPEVTPVELIKLPVSALGLPGTPTTRQIFERAPQCRVGDMALEFCRAEVGPHQAIKDIEQPLNDYYYIMHEPIAGRRGLPRVFELARDDDGLWLSDDWALPEGRWYPERQLVFTLRKVEPVKP